MTIKLIPLGFVFLNKRKPLEDPERINDWINMEIEMAEVKHMLNRGTFDDGLMVRMVYEGKPGGIGVVVPDPKGGQMIKPLEEVTGGNA